MYDGDIPYISPLEEWINEVCKSDASPWYQFQAFKVLKKVWFPALIKIKIMVQTQHIINEVLSWITIKDKGKYEMLTYMVTLVV